MRRRLRVVCILLGVLLTSCLASANQNKLELLDKKFVVQLYQLMKDVHEVLSKHNVTYWIDSGTLLGAVRHKPGGIIPWDDDVDIAMPINEEEKFVQLVGVFRSLGYGVEEWYYGYKIYYLDGSPIEDKPFNFPFCDIFILEIQEGKTYVPRSDLWPDCYYLQHDIVPLKLWDFGSLKLWGPKNPIPYLDCCFPDWKEVGLKGKDHETYKEDVEMPVRIALAQLGLEPATPFGPLEDRVSQLERT